MTANSLSSRSWMRSASVVRPVIYPLSTITNEELRLIMQLNPLTGIVEFFKYGMLGVGNHDWWMLGYSFGFMVVLLAVGIVVFNKVQKSFMDTV